MALSPQDLEAIRAALGGEYISVAAQEAELENIRRAEVAAQQAAQQLRATSRVVIRAQAQAIENNGWSDRESTMNAQNFTFTTSINNLRIRYANINTNALLDEIRAHVANIDCVVVSDNGVSTNLGKKATDAVNHYAGNIYYESTEYVCLAWCAAKDNSPAVLACSSVEKRKRAFVFALESAIRGNNRNNEAAMDDLAPDNRVICGTGFKHKLLECLNSAILETGHPDIVFEPEIREYLSARVNAHLFSEYFKGTKAEQAAMEKAWKNDDAKFINEVIIEVKRKLAIDLARLGAPQADSKSVAEAKVRVAARLGSQVDREIVLIDKIKTEWVDCLGSMNLPTEKQKKDHYEKQLKENHEKDLKAAKDLAEALKAGDQKRIFEQAARAKKEQKERADRMAALAPAPANAPNPAQDLAARMRAAMQNAGGVQPAGQPVPTAAPAGLQPVIGVQYAQAQLSQEELDFEANLAFAECLSELTPDAQAKTMAELQPPQPVAAPSTAVAVQPTAAPAVTAQKLSKLRRLGGL